MKKMIVIFVFVLVYLLPGRFGEAAYISNKSIVLQNGKSKQLRLKKAKGKIYWKSSDPSVASVSGKGLVQAKKQGNCVIYATCRKATYKCSVKVTQNTRTAKFLSIVKRYIDIMNEDIANKMYWTYGAPEASGFHQSREKYKRITCIYPVVWALREMHVFSNKDMFWAGDTDICYSGGARSKTKKNFHLIKVHAPLSQLVAADILQEGDILFMEKHTNVYAGNGKFYDTGRSASDGHFEELIYYYDGARPVPVVKDFMTYYILRFK